MELAATPRVHRSGRRIRGVVARVRGQGAFGVAVVLAVLLVVLFVLYPIAQILGKSLSADGREQWRRLWQSTLTFQTIRNTMVLGVLVGLVGTAVGLLMAFVQVRTRLAGRRIVHVLMLIPIVSPPFAVAMSIIALFGRRGLVTYQLLGIRYDIYGLRGMVLAISLSYMPIAYLNFVGMLRAFDGSLEEAATMLGGGAFHRLRTVVLPLLAPGIASSFLLLFVSSIAELGNPVLLSGNYDVLSVRIYLAVIGEFSLDKAAVYSMMLLVPSLAIFSLQYLWLRRKEYVTITGKVAAPLRPVSSLGAKTGLGVFAVAVSGFIVLLYGYMVVGAFTRVWNINFEFTLDHFRFVLQGSGLKALKDTALLAALATPIAGFAGLIIAFVITQRRFPGRSMLDFASVLGVAVPGTIIGIGLLLGFNRPLLWGAIPRLQGTAAIIVLAFTIRSLPGVVRVAVGALNQLGSNLEEASISLGASTSQTFRKVVLPLIRPAMFSSLVWSFATSMTTLSPIIFLLTPRWRIMTAQVLNEADQGRFSRAAAYSVVLVCVVLMAIGLLALVTGFSSLRSHGRNRRMPRANVPGVVTPASAAPHAALRGDQP